MTSVPIHREETEGDLRETKGHMRTETEIGGTEPQSQNAWSLQRWEETVCSTSKESSSGHGGLWLQIKPEEFISAH